MSVARVPAARVSEQSLGQRCRPADTPDPAACARHRQVERRPREARRHGGVRIEPDRAHLSRTPRAAGPGVELPAAIGFRRQRDRLEAVGRVRLRAVRAAVDQSVVARHRSTGVWGDAQRRCRRLRNTRIGRDTTADKRQRQSHQTKPRVPRSLGSSHHGASTSPLFR